MGVGVVVQGHLEVEGVEDGAFEGDDFLLRDGPLTLAGHGSDLGWINLVHFAGQQE